MRGWRWPTGALPADWVFRGSNEDTSGIVTLVDDLAFPVVCANVPEPHRRDSRTAAVVKVRCIGILLICALLFVQTKMRIAHDHQDASFGLRNDFGAPLLAYRCNTAASTAGETAHSIVRLVRRIVHTPDAIRAERGSSIEMNRIRSGISERDELAEGAGRRRQPGLALPGKAHVHSVNIVIQCFEIDDVLRETTAGRPCRTEW
jgi:hypothetical protein